MSTSVPNVISDHQSAAETLSAYEPPVLRPLGDVRELTLGGSPGSGDSGGSFTQEF